MLIIKFSSTVMQGKRKLYSATPDFYSKEKDNNWNDGFHDRRKYFNFNVNSFTNWYFYQSQSLENVMFSQINRVIFVTILLNKKIPVEELNRAMLLDYYSFNVLAENFFIFILFPISRVRFIHRSNTVSYF